jgi:flagellar biosynthesis/type III secretory pathway M-ring protein FliF/YscJ
MLDLLVLAKLEGAAGVAAMIGILLFAFAGNLVIVRALKRQRIRNAREAAQADESQAQGRRRPS